VADAMNEYLYIGRLVVLLVLLAVAVYWEIKEKRIPNVVTGAGFVLGFLLAYLMGTAVLWSSVVGFAIGFGFLLIIYLFGGIGGGDVKFMGAVGVLVGYPLVLPVLFLSTVIGGMMGVAIWCWTWRAAPAAAGQATPAKPAVPYGVAIVLGTLIALAVSV